MSTAPESIMCRAMARRRRTWTEAEREARRQEIEASVRRRGWRRLATRLAHCFVVGLVLAAIAKEW